jgi:hypothetical protein
VFFNMVGFVFLSHRLNISLCVHLFYCQNLLRAELYFQREAFSSKPGNHPASSLKSMKKA